MISGPLVVLLAVCLLLLLFMIGVPIFAAFIICNIIGVYWLMGVNGFGLYANSIYETATTASLATVPLFLLIGEILFRGKAVDVLFDAVDRIVPGVRGRQHYLTICLATVFGALSGTAMGVAAMLGRAILPGVRERNLDVRLATGAILAGASLAPIIPPSVLVIIIGTLAGVSISSLLIAGIVPGLMLALLFAAYIFVRVRVGSMAEAEAVRVVTDNAISRSRALLRIAPFSIIFIMILGFILGGVATPSEAAATGVVGALITTWIYGGLSWSVVWESLKSAIAVAAMILLIMAASKMLAQLLAFSGGTAALTSLVVELGYDRWVMLFLLLAFPFIACMFIDQIALMLLIIPIYQPVLQALGFDPIWFWTLFLINITLGGMTPPFGYTIFALKGAADDLSLSQIFSASWPFVGIFVLGMIILAVAPQLTTFLPNLM